MAKRVKKGFRAVLAPGRSECFPVEASDSGGVLRLYKHELKECVYLTADQCEALGMTAVLEDVPEPRSPGQRLGDVLSRMGFGGVGQQQLELAAAALGIKPEGES